MLNSNSPQHSDTRVSALKLQVSNGYLYMDVRTTQFILAIKRDEFARKGIHFEAYFRQDKADDSQNLLRFVSQLAKMANKLEKRHVRRVQLIYRIGIHTMAIDFCLQKSGMQCFMIDAINSEWLGGTYHALASSKQFSVIYVAAAKNYQNNVQSRHGTCHFFAIEQAITVSQMDPYPQLAEHSVLRQLPSPSGVENTNPTCHCVTWNKLDKDFIKDAEARQVLELYYHENPDVESDRSFPEDKNLREYVADRSDKSVSNPAKYPNFPYLSMSILIIAVNYFQQMQAQIKVSKDSELSQVCRELPLLTHQQWLAARDSAPTVFVTQSRFKPLSCEAMAAELLATGEDINSQLILKY